ncbi:MAG TPA: nitrous oxide reductase family maturation protein NosD, partial [Ferruginibacter sp.]|nr:nitrous oxide reductase family maturation protein NosD [Ferruginibacter sp.]
MKGMIINIYGFIATLVLLLLNSKDTNAAVLKVGKGEVYKQIKEAVKQSKNGDTLIVFSGLYKEGNIIIDKSICLLGEGSPVLDGEIKYEIFSVKHSNVTIKGFTLQNSGRTVMEDPGAIKVYECSNILIEGNILINNYFGI